jgi:23S rRNA pseudouridine1911/1915/1917 synthase
MDQKRIAEMKENPKAPYYIVYEDSALLVVYKKREVFTIATPDPKTYHHNLFYYLQAYSKANHETVYLIHRLDFETSGLMLFAKTPAIQNALKTAFETHDVGRYYEAVVKESLPVGKHYDVQQYLLEEGANVHVSDPEHGKEAITHVEVKNPIQIGSALAITIDTGRKNQIRIALHSLGLTLLGDKRYSANEAKRMYLNAYRLTLPESIPVAQRVFSVEPLWLKND